MYDPLYISAFTRGFIVLITLWTIPWKVYAVWLAAKSNQKKWFVVLLILNTASILELIYIFKIEKKTWVEVKRDFREAWHTWVSRKK